MSETRANAIATWAWHQEALESLRHTLDVLDRVQVPVIVVKGMVLAYSLYDDVADRPMSDVDLRVRPRDLIRAARAMRARGFPIDWGSRQLGALAFHVGAVMVELEASVGPPGLCGMGVSEMLSRSRERLLPNGLRVHEPEPHDHAILLVVNAFKEKLTNIPLRSVRDLDTIAQQIDIDTFVERVRAAGVSTMTWLVADWLVRERTSARWCDIRGHLGTLAPRRQYARALRTAIREHPRSVMTTALARIASDSVSRRAWALAATAAGVGVRGVARYFWT